MNPEELLEFIYIFKCRMQIEHGYALLERLDVLLETDTISLGEYSKRKQDIIEALEDYTQDNPFNQLKEELNLFTL
jgi:hypothetical protein